ncbi:hypothetical protein BPOR_0639g00040 [Botrytis porri]|uniref:Uncharacterized protein n=1 Tax=Botrytis porri TaxID=87229 RepID=A0A4Z1KBE6_9HELO|nr:hypothetical protein BPOR_0639g00040 [Botrytis porri]
MDRSDPIAISSSSPPPQTQRFPESIARHTIQRFSLLPIIGVESRALPIYEFADAEGERIDENIVEIGITVGEEDGARGSMDEETFLSRDVEVGGGVGGRRHVGVGAEMLLERIEGRKGTAGISESEVVTGGITFGATKSDFSLEAVGIVYFAHLGEDGAEIVNEIGEV